MKISYRRIYGQLAVVIASLWLPWITYATPISGYHLLLLLQNIPPLIAFMGQGVQPQALGWLCLFYPQVALLMVYVLLMIFAPQTKAYELVEKFVTALPLLCVWVAAVMLSLNFFPYIGTGIWILVLNSVYLLVARSLAAFASTLS